MGLQPKSGARADFLAKRVVVAVYGSVLRVEGRNYKVRATLLSHSEGFERVGACRGDIEHPTSNAQMAGGDPSRGF